MVEVASIASNNGDIKALNYHACKCVDLEQDYREKILMLLPASDRGCPIATFMLAGLHEANGMEVDYEMIKYAADEGYTEAMRVVGLTEILRRGLCVEGIEWVVRAALGGDTFSQAYISSIYREGNDFINVNEMKAFNHANISTAAGNIKGGFELGRCFEDGVGCKMDSEKAKALYRLVAEEGENLEGVETERAMFSLGYILFKENDMAYVEWMEKAIEGGSIDAGRFLDARDARNRPPSLSLFPFLLPIFLSCLIYEWF